MAPARNRSRGRPPGEPGKWKPAFLEALGRVPIVTLAARSAQVAPSSVYEARKVDPGFAEDWDAAIAIGADVCEIEVWRRGITGVVKPVFQGGQQVGEIREYSDRMLELLIKRHKPHLYRERHSLEHTGRAGLPIEVTVISPREELVKRLDRIAGRTNGRAITSTPDPSAN